MREIKRFATQSAPVDPANPEDDVNLLTETFPVTELVLSFTTADEDGRPVTTTETISGESAEFLPHILKRIEVFLDAVGFDVNVQVADDDTQRLGKALQALILSDDRKAS